MRDQSRHTETSDDANKKFLFSWYVKQRELLGVTGIFQFHYNLPGSERGGDGKGLLVEIHLFLVNTNDATLCQICIQCGVVVYTIQRYDVFEWSGELQ